MAESQAFVDVVADISQAQNQLEQDLNDLIQTVENGADAVQVQTQIDANALAQQVQETIQVTEDSTPPVQVSVDIDPGEISRLTRSLATSIRSIEAGAGSIDLDLEVNQLAVTQVERQLVDFQRQLGGIDVDVNTEVDPVALATAVADVDRLRRRISDLTEEAEDEINIDIDTDDAMSGLDALDHSFDDFSQGADEARGRSDRFGSSLAAVGGIAGSTLASLSALTVGLSSLAGAVGAATLGVTSLVDSLGGVDGAASQAAAGIGVYRTANVLLRVSLIGVADAFEAAFGEAEDFEEALEGLSHEAQHVAMDFRSVTPEIEAFQQSLQDSLFNQIQSEQAAKDLGSALEEIEPAASKVTAAFGNIIDNLIQFAISDDAVEDFKTVIEATAPAVDRFGEIVLSLAERSLSSAADGTDELSDTMGRLEGFARTVHGAMKDVGDIFESVGESADRTGTTLEFSLVTGLDAAAKALNTDAGESFLDSLLGLASAITSTVVPALGGMVLAVAPLVESLADALTPAVEGLLDPLQTLTGELSAGLQPVVEALDPILLNLATSAGDVAVAFAPLLPILGDLGSLIIPALNPIIDFLRRILLALSPVVLAAARAFSAFFTPVLERLPEIVDAVLRPLADMAERVLPQVASAIRDATPSLQRLGELFAENIDKLLPLIREMVRLAAEVVPQLAPVLLELFPYLIQLATLFFEISNTVADVLIPALREVSSFIDRTVNASFASLAVSVGASLTEIVRDAAGLTPGSQRAMLPFPPALGRIGNDAARRLVNAMSEGFDRAVSLARSLPGRVVNAMGNLGRVLYNSGRSLVNGFIDGMLSLLGAVADAANSVVSTAADFFPFSPAKEGPFSGRGYTLFSGQTLAEDFARGIEESTVAAERAAEELASVAGAQITPVTAAPGMVGTMVSPVPTGAAGGRLEDLRRALAAGSVNVNLTVINRGVLGSQADVLDWLATSLENLRRTRRLPIGA